MARGLLLGGLVVWLEVRRGNWLSGFTRRCKPSLHRNAYFGDCRLRAMAECRAGLKIGDVRDPSLVFIRPEYDNGVPVHCQRSSFNPYSRMISRSWRNWYGFASFPTR